MIMLSVMRQFKEIAFSGISPLAPECIEKEFLFDERLYLVVSEQMLKNYFPDRYPECVEEFKRGANIRKFMQILNKNKWVADMSTAILVSDCLSTISLSRIDCSGMTEPRPEKYKYYEDYYKRTGELPHDILIDENNCIMDGYITWLLANKYQNDMGMQWKFNIHKADSTIPHAKIVVGRHVNVSESDITIRGPQYFKWIYNKKELVVPGDILKVDTRKGDAYMVVEAIRYIAGAKNCAEYRHVIEHTGMIMQEQSIR